MIKLPRIFSVTCHTKYVGPGSIFVAIKGLNEDGTTYIPLALQKGAQTIVIQKNYNISEAAIKKAKAKLLKVENGRKALAQLSAKQLGYPAKKLKIIGVTGTKGKTSTTFILEHILRNSGYKTALISTVHNKILNEKFKSNLTTEQPDYLHIFFKMCVEAQIDYVVMEVSAQSLSLYRVYGIEFDSVVFTNLKQEHGEFYNNIDDYFKEKCKIFEQLKAGAPAFINADDPWGNKILQNNPHFFSFGSKQQYKFYFTLNKNRSDNLSCVLRCKNEEYEFNCPSLIGEFNCYNLLGAVCVAKSLGVPLHEASNAILSFAGVPGRLDLHYLKNGARCFIDYAHNPSSFEAVLSTLRPLTNHLIALFGAGGERDETKRPLMGKIASQIADVVILTSDNPRSEPPNSIIDDIYSGIPKNNKSTVIIEVNREKAIKIACKLTQKFSIVALLGKGPDEYQIIGDVKISFSEKNIIQN